MQQTGCEKCGLARFEAQEGGLPCSMGRGKIPLPISSKEETQRKEKWP